MRIINVTMEDIENRIREMYPELESEDALAARVWDCASFLITFDDILIDQMVQLWRDRERIEKVAKIFAHFEEVDWEGLVEVMFDEEAQEAQEEAEAERQLQATTAPEAN
jgi:hypothetical protein